MGDRHGYESGFARLKGEALGPGFEQYFASDRMKPEARCATAETNREARFNRLFERVGGESGTTCLVTHGCSGW